MPSSLTMMRKTPPLLSRLLPRKQLSPSPRRLRTDQQPLSPEAPSTTPASTMLSAKTPPEAAEAVVVAEVVLPVAIVVAVVAVEADPRAREDPDPKVAISDPDLKVAISDPDPKVAISDPDLKAVNSDPEEKVKIDREQRVAVAEAEVPVLPEMRARLSRVVTMESSLPPRRNQSITKERDADSRVREESSSIPSIEETALAEAEVSLRAATARATGALLKTRPRPLPSKARPPSLRRLRMPLRRPRVRRPLRPSPSSSRKKKTPRSRPLLSTSLPRRDLLPRRKAELTTK